ncbi:MAG: GntR family transcriptional regulator, partial [Oscillospiraceae bacterium]|nr:GntR family transcriptional regulator [Oscillospiraceae bacterium]
MTWTFDRDRPIYIQLQEGITMRIVSGEYAPGERMPAVRDLAAEAAVNPNTVQRALSELERAGLVYAQRTNGRFVTEETQRITDAKASLARERVRQFLVSRALLGVGLDEAAALSTAAVAS